MLLMSVSIPLVIQFASQFSCKKVVHSDLELPFCQLWNWFKFSATSSHFFPFAAVLFFVPVKGSTTLISRHNISSWRELHVYNMYHWLSKKIRIQFKRNLELKMKLLFKWAKGKHLVDRKAASGVPIINYNRSLIENL